MLYNRYSVAADGVRAHARASIRNTDHMLHLHNSWRRKALGIACLVLVAPLHAWAAPAAGVYLEDMTSPELRDRIAAGTTTALVPIGGTEQSGPHIVLGKHNVRARVLAGRIAGRLGDAVVAPVVAYVPEGAITPPAAHMRFAGTLSIPDAAFESVLESTALSLCRHGIRDVFFLGDHGGYQNNEERAAAKVNRAAGCRAHALTAYYDAATTAFNADLKRRGFTDAEIGTHAGLADTALSLAVDPALVRPAQVAAGAQGGVRAGVHGDPTRATAELGRIGVERIVDASVTAIRAARQPATEPNPNSSHRK
jgi:creatinine amidohydrolase/Fe(II)-dependent formamide hydrolase-like protein